MGAAAREAAAREAHASINSQLSQALASGAKVEVAAAVARALRLLTVQLKMLRMDAANFRLTVLADALKDGSGIRSGLHAHQMHVYLHGCPACLDQLISGCVCGRSC